MCANIYVKGNALCKHVGTVVCIFLQDRAKVGVAR